MKKMLLWLLLVPLLAIPACTIVPIEEMEALEASEQFDPAVYVDGIWADQVVPTLVDNAQELPVVLAALEDDLDAAAETYATISPSGALNFVVKGQGVIETVDSESRNGTAVVNVEGYDGAITVIVQVGPLVRGDGIRDGVGFIEFGDFRDQTEFGQVSRELNRRVSADVLGDLDLASLAGQTVDFSGVFSILTTNQTNINVGEVTISPIAFGVGG